MLPSRKGAHLHFVLTPPLRKRNIERVLLVGITSTKIDPDFTLDEGDHPFIRHKSYINYPKARIMSVKEIEQGIKATNRDEKISPRQKAEPEIIKLICKGLFEFEDSPSRYKRFCREACRKK